MQTPVILIRHPALMIPSYYSKQKFLFVEEAWDEEFAVIASLCWARMVFDAYSQLYQQRADGNQTTKCPIIVDAHDVVYNTKAIMRKLCVLIRCRGEA